MKRIAISAALLLALCGSSFAQVAQTPRYDSKAYHDSTTEAERAHAQRVQNEPFVAPDTRLRPVRPETKK